jgi:hypothetical protein
MAITNEDIVALASAFHDASMVKKSTAAGMAEFFFYPESRIFVLHGGDLTLQANYEIHQKLVDETHWTVGTWDVTPLSDDPERARARARGIVYWQGRHVDQADGALLKSYVGEDWMVERVPSGELKFVVYVNTDHSFLPGSATVDI